MAERSPVYFVLSAMTAAAILAVPPSWAQSIATDGNVETDAQLVSNVTTGTAPLAVSSTTKVQSLNADQVDGLEGTDLEAMILALQTQLDTLAQAMQTGDPSCPDDSANVYVDCGNGTVTDNRTGLVWLKQANCLATCSISGAPCTVDSDCPAAETCSPRAFDWYTAMEFVAGLSDIADGAAWEDHDCGLSDGSSPGEWRLPSIDEWTAMISAALAGPPDPDCTATPPVFTDDSGLGCWIDGSSSSFSNVVSGRYWSSSTYIERAGTALPMALAVDLSNGGHGDDQKSGAHYVWPVRGGQ